MKGSGQRSHEIDNVVKVTKHGDRNEQENVPQSADPYHLLSCLLRI